VVDVDLEKFFDRVNHDILIDRLRKRIDDAGIIRLIRAYLNSGIMSDGVVLERYQGTPQGGPLSPLLANVLLDEVDKVLEKRGYIALRATPTTATSMSAVEKAGERVMALLRKCTPSYSSRSMRPRARWQRIRAASFWATASGWPRKESSAGWPTSQWRRSSSGSGN
jgi:RNA-directed DNA polymerase